MSDKNRRIPYDFHAKPIDALRMNQIMENAPRLLSNRRL